MTNDNNDKAFGQMLRKAATTKTPPGLDIVIMQKIRAAELRRSYRRMIGAFVLRFCSVLLLVVVGGKMFLAHTSNRDVAGLVTNMPDNLASAGSWLSGHTYLILPFLIIALLTWRIGHSLRREL